MRRGLAELAPRNAVVALEGAVRDLTERLALLREKGHGETALAQLDLTAEALRATLRKNDPRSIAKGLEQEIRAIGDKVESLARTLIKPETLEPIRLQTEEVRDILAAAVARTSPVERLERQIGELADRIEQLGASSASQIETAKMAASIDEMRKEIERSTPLPALLSIEQRLERIANRLDQELSRPLPDASNPGTLADLGSSSGCNA